MAEAEAVKREEAEGPGPYRVRKARLGDVGEMRRIISHYAERQLMLPKTHLEIYENLRDYSVVTDAGPAGAVLACGALHIYWEDLAEVRAVAVDPELGGRGAGTALVKRLLAEAREIGVEKAFVFTYVPDFFSRFGFVEVEHSAMPLKVYNECFQCPKFNQCDEIAMVVHL
jgi:amino-acid N-acetyltransferase